MTDTRTHAREEKKLSVIRKGHWRNKYIAINPMRLFNPDTADIRPIESGDEYFGFGEWPTQERAEEVAADGARNPESDQGSGDARYLGPVFFPDKSDP